MADQVAKNQTSDDRAGLEQLLERAMHGDETSRDEVCKLLEDVPQLIGALGGDLARVAERALVRALAGKNVALREAVHKKMQELRSELIGPNTQPLERLLAERVVLCWLHVHHADYQYGSANDIRLAHGDYLQRQQDRAQRRYLAAIKCLATVRRLALPIKLDVNVSGTVQSNPAGPTCRRSVERLHTRAQSSV